MAKKVEEERHVIISWASEFVEGTTTMAVLQAISRDVEKLYTKQTGKPIQITTILRKPKEKS